MLLNFTADLVLLLTVKHQWVDPRQPVKRGLQEKDIRKDLFDQRVVFVLTQLERVGEHWILKEVEYLLGQA